MDDALIDTAFRAQASAERPLLGLTVLVVEDSRYASEAVRLLCLRSGARIRRADCIASAERHLNVYRPSVALIDLGLPDGSGLDLVARMHAMQPRVPVLLGTSGADRDTARDTFLAAGADGFLPKPIPSLRAFQAAILDHLPDAMRPDDSPSRPEPEPVAPDLVSLREDLTHAIALLALDEPPARYLRRFLLGLARSADDPALEGQARDIGAALALEERRSLRQFLSRRIQDLPLAV